MQILRDIPIHLTAEQVLEAQKGGRRRKSARNISTMLTEVQRAIEQAIPLYEPAIIYTELDVQKVEPERVLVVPTGTGVPHGADVPHVLHIGPHADLLGSATRLLAGVYTLGPALEEQVAQLNASGEILAAYWLDTVGVMALGAVGETLRCVAEEEATQRDWGVSPALSPGSLVGWSLQGQREICELLSLADVGVRLNRHCVLEPHKSGAVVIGLGPGYETHQVGSVCHLCALADSCWRRH